MKQRRHILYNLCLAVLICIFLGSAGYLAYYFLQSKKSEDQFQELEAMIDTPVGEEEVVYVATAGDAEPIGYFLCPLRHIVLMGTPVS